MILRRSSGRPLALLSSNGRLEHGDLFTAWDVLDEHGRTVQANPGPDLVGSKVGPFVTSAVQVTSSGGEELTALEQSLLYALSSWYILGALERALDLAAVYATERVAFGSPISRYQGVAFPIADAYAEVVALHELALYTLHSAYDSPESSLVEHARAQVCGTGYRPKDPQDLASSTRCRGALRRTRPQRRHPWPSGATATTRQHGTDIGEALRGG